MKASEMDEGVLMGGWGEKKTNDAVLQRKKGENGASK